MLSYRNKIINVMNVIIINVNNYLFKFTLKINCLLLLNLVIQRLSNFVFEKLYILNYDIENC